MGGLSGCVAGRGAHGLRLRGRQTLVRARRGRAHGCSPRRRPCARAPPPAPPRRQQMLQPARTRHAVVGAVRSLFDREGQAVARRQVQRRCQVHRPHLGPLRGRQCSGDGASAGCGQGAVLCGPGWRTLAPRARALHFKPPHPPTHPPLCPAGWPATAGPARCTRALCPPPPAWGGAVGGSELDGGAGGVSGGAGSLAGRQTGRQAGRQPPAAASHDGTRARPCSPHPLLWPHSTDLVRLVVSVAHVQADHVHAGVCQAEERLAVA